MGKDGADVGIGFGGLRVLLLVGRVAAGAGEVERGVGGAVGIGVFVGSAMMMSTVCLCVCVVWLEMGR